MLFSIGDTYMDVQRPVASAYLPLQVVWYDTRSIQQFAQVRLASTAFSSKSALFQKLHLGPMHCTRCAVNMAHCLQACLLPQDGDTALQITQRRRDPPDVVAVTKELGLKGTRKSLRAHAVHPLLHSLRTSCLMASWGVTSLPGPCWCWAGQSRL